MFRIYRKPENKSAPLLDFDDVQEDDRILFGAAFSYNGNYIRQWRVNGLDLDVRLLDLEAIVSVAPSLLHDDDTNPIEIKLVLGADGLEDVVLTAYLHLECETYIVTSCSSYNNNIEPGQIKVC